MWGTFLGGYLFKLQYFEYGLFLSNNVVIKNVIEWIRAIVLQLLINCFLPCHPY